MGSMIPQELADVPLDQIQEHPRNPRRGDVATIARSIESNGWYGAVLVQRSTGYILAGNHRYQAAQAQGLARLPVLWLDVDDALALRILLADNRTSDLATNDEEVLRELLAQIAHTDGTLDGTGYSSADLARLLEEVGLPEQMPGCDQSEELSDQFHILIECRSEAEQTELLRRLEAEGYPCRALVA